MQLKTYILTGVLMTALVWIAFKIPYSDEMEQNEMSFQTRTDNNKNDHHDVTDNKEDSNHLSQTLKRHKQGQASVVIIRVTYENEETNNNTHVMNMNPDAPYYSIREDEPKKNHDTDDTNDYYNNYDDNHYLVQRKSSDYPISAFVNTLCLYGGNSEPSDDDQPYQTLIRELREELPSHMANVLIQNGFRFIDFSYHYQNAHVMRKDVVDEEKENDMKEPETGITNDEEESVSVNENVNVNVNENKEEDYGFVCALYEAQISWSDLYEMFINNDGDGEGNFVILTRDEMLHGSRNTYAWGYDYTMSNYFGEKADKFCDGVSVMDLGNGGDDGDSHWISPRFRQK